VFFPQEVESVFHKQFQAPCGHSSEIHRSDMSY
jgi:hypothetical protein